MTLHGVYMSAMIADGAVIRQSCLCDRRRSQWIESLLPVPTTATSHVDRELIMQWTDAAQSRSSLDVDSQLGASRPHACQLSSSSVAVSLKRPLLVPLSVCLSVSRVRDY